MTEGSAGQRAGSVRSWREALLVYARPRVFAMIWLGCSAGLPTQRLRCESRYAGLWRLGGARGPVLWQPVGGKPGLVGWGPVALAIPEQAVRSEGLAVDQCQQGVRTDRPDGHTVLDIVPVFGHGSVRAVLRWVFSLFLQGNRRSAHGFFPFMGR